MNRQLTSRALSFKADFSPLLKLAIPLILTGAIQSSLGFFENVFLAQLGQQVLAASALVSWLFFTMISLIFGIFGSVNVLISHRYGANDQLGITGVLRDALILAIFLTPLAFLLFWNASDILLLFGQKPELVALAKLYLHGLAWGLFPKFILIVAFELLMGLGHSRMILIVSMVSIPFYILFSYILIFGKFGFPMLAIAGAGWGMTIADWIITTIVCVLLWFSKSYRQYVRSVFAWIKPTYFWEILHIGIPMGAMFCVETGYFFMMTLAMGWIGVETLAANQIAMQYLGGLTSVVFSASQAISVRMGHLLGANEINAAKKAAYAGVVFSVTYMLLVALLYWFTPRTLISVDFNPDNPVNEEIIQLATVFLFICAFFQILEAIRLSLFGALRGLKDTRFTLVTSIICFWCIALPAGYYFSIPLGFGGEAFWWAMVAGAFCSVVLLVRRFHSIISSSHVTSVP